jgi:hypothetical protein
VANPDDCDVKAACTFRVTGRQPELWDPVSGTTYLLPESQVKEGCTVVPLQFATRQSWFVVFRPATGDQQAVVKTKSWPKLDRVQELTGPWEVSFDAKWGGPEHVIFEKLDDWTTRPELGIRYYSGKAIYRKTFDLPSLKTEPSAANRLYLDLGVVKNLAAVRLNGHDLGAVWCAPWQVDVTDLIKPRDNRLEITVANLWPNRLIGDQSLPPEKRFAWTTWDPFREETPLIESGLLGPVTLQATGDAATK